MEQNKPEKVVIFATHGGEDPERATLPFVIGNAALAMDAKVIMCLQATGVTLAKKGCYEHVFAANLDPLKKLVDSFLEFGGTILVCIPCIEQRKITPDMLIQGAQPVKAARVVQEMLEAKAVLSY
jgi:predicted peroxiredoxin